MLIQSEKYYQNSNTEKNIFQNVPFSMRSLITLGIMLKNNLLNKNYHRHKLLRYYVSCMNYFVAPKMQFHSKRAYKFPVGKPLSLLFRLNNCFIEYSSL